MSNVQKILDLLEGDNLHQIEVSVRDANKAQTVIKDDPNIKFTNKGSNRFLFADVDDFDSAMNMFKRAKIEILVSGQFR